MPEGKAEQTKYYRESVKKNFMVGIFFFIVACFSIYIEQNLNRIAVAFIVFGFYKLIICSINYFSLKKAEKNFLDNRK